MASYSDTERPRHGRERRPRYVYDSDSDQGPPLPRREPRRDRPPPPPFQPDEPSSKPPRRRSILIDPDETSSQKDHRRRARSNSRVRLQTSSDDESDYRQTGRPSREPRGSRRDLERKNSQDNLRFREKRDGYESDEGEALRRSRSAREPDRSRRREFEGGPPEYGGFEPKPYRGDTLRPPRAGAQDASLPMRGKRRDPADTPVTYGAPPVAAAMMPEPPPIGASRTADYARDTIPTRRDREGNYDPYAGPPHPPPGERDDPRRRPRRNTDYDDERGYRSDGPPRRRPDRHEREGHGDYDGYDRRRGDDDYRPRGDRRPGGPRYDDYHSDHRESRPARYDGDRTDRRDRFRDTNYDPRDRYRDNERRRSFHDDRDRVRDKDRDRDKSRKKKSPDWQKEAGALFMGYAMPVIRKEGTKLFRDQMQKFLTRREGGGPA